MSHEKQDRTGGNEPNEQATVQASSVLRAVVNVRISDDPEGTERGVERQEADCRAYAAAHGWEVAQAFHARREVYRAGILTHRVELVWRA